MRSLFSLVLAFLITAAVARAESTLVAARLAQRMLGAEAWTRVIRIENEGRSHRYPRIVHALVFELAGLLWFYAPEDGTQSFSRHRDQLEAEKADFGPLLRDIDPGFQRWVAVPDEQQPGDGRSHRLPNGCFIESVCALQEQLARGAEIFRPRLLSYYFAPGTRRPGHTILMYEAKDGVRIVDPARGGREERLPASLAADPLGAARMLEGAVVSTARILPLPVEKPARLAGRPGVGAAGKG